MRNVKTKGSIIAIPKVGQNLRVFIPKEVAQKLGIKEGERVAFVEEENGKIVIFRATEKIEIVDHTEKKR